MRGGAGTVGGERGRGLELRAEVAVDEDVDAVARRQRRHARDAVHVLHLPRRPRGDGARAGMFGPDRAEGAVDVCGIRCGGEEKSGLRLDGEQAPRGLWVPRSSPRPLLESAGRLPGLPARRFVCGFRALGEGAHGAALRRTHQKVDDWIRGGAKSLDGIKDAHAQPKSRGGRSDKGQPRFSPRALRGLEKRTV